MTIVVIFFFPASALFYFVKGKVGRGLGVWDWGLAEEKNIYSN